MTGTAAASPTRQSRSSPGTSRRMVRMPKSRLQLISSPKGATKQTVRAPILLELALNQGQISVGWVGQPRHQTIRFVPLPPRILRAPDYYRIYAPRLLEILEWLGGEGNNRRVLVCHDFGYFIPAACQNAVERALLEAAGYEAVSFHSCWWKIPAAAPAVQDALVIAVTMTGAHCYAYAAGEVLAFTYQSCTTSGEVSGKTATSEWSKQQTEWLESQENSLVLAVLACLQACPRASRRAVVHNLWLVGNVILDPPRYAKAIAKALKRRLQGEENVSSTTSDTQDMDISELPISESSSSTFIPIAIKELKSLASEVSAIKIDSADLPWLGASRWAHQLHNDDPDADSFQWKFRESNEKNK